MFKRLVFDGMCIVIIGLNLALNRTMLEAEPFLHFVFAIFEVRYITFFIRDSIRYARGG